MRVQRWLSMMILCVLAGLLLPMGSTSLDKEGVWAAPSPPDPQFELILLDPEAISVASGSAADGLFPDRWFRLRATGTSYNLKDSDLGFTIEVSYPHPYAAYFTEANPSITWNQYVHSCTHDVANRKFSCVGALPKSDPTQEMDAWVEIAFIGTCDLYTQPQPSVVNFVGTSNWDDGGFNKDTYAAPVEPILDLTLLSQNPADGTKDLVISDENQRGPLLTWSPYLNHTCGDGSDPVNQDVAYLVRLRKQGGTWRDFSNEYPTCSKELRLSPSDVPCEDNGEPATYEWDVAIADIRYARCGAVASNVAKFTTGSCRPEVEVKPKYGDFFLSGLNVANTYRVEVDWNGSADTATPQAPFGEVIFDLNDDEMKRPGQRWGAEHQYNMGDDFNAGLTGGNNVLAIKAVNADGLESLVSTLQPMVFPVPSWIIDYAMDSFNVQLKARTVTYGRSVEYPNPHFEANTTVPSWVPYLGGAKMGINETYAAVGAEVSSDGSGSVGVSGNTGVQLTEDKKVSGKLSGNGEVQISAGSGVDLTEATFGLTVKGEIAEEMGIADLVPALKAAENWWLVGRLVKWFNRRANVEAAIGPEVDIKTKFVDVNDDLEFRSGTGTGLIDMALTLTLRVFDSLKASLTGGGTPRVVVQVPKSGPWGYLKEIAIRLYAKAGLTVWRFEEEWERGITCSLPDGRCESDEGEAMALALAADGWTLMDRDYVTEDYATFTANRGFQLMATATTMETQVVQDVFPLADPALAVRADGDRMVLWVHDDDGKPIAQGEEIRAAHWNGSSWTEASVTGDNHQDFNPQVAFDGDGDALAVWERTNTVHVSPTLDITYTQSFEIASARWDSTTETWSAVTLLTSDALLDTSPQLARSTDGTLVALWRTSDGTDLLGTPAHPVTLTFDVWNGTTWAGAAPALTGLTDTLGVDLAVYSSSRAALVLARDTDGDLLTDADTELFYATYNGAVWSALTPLTDDAVADVAAELSYDDSGNPIIVWRRNDALVMQTGWAGSPTTVRPLSTSGAFFDFELLPDANGNLALLWQAITEDGADVTYAVYDASHNSWGSDNTLMNDAALEESFAPAFAPDGTLTMAYNKVAMELITQTVEVSPTLTITATNVPNPVKTDLYLLTHTIGRDLGVTAADLALSDPNPAPGSQVTVSATVHNLGDLAVSGAQVAFYDGDPGSGGAQIGSAQALVSPFRAAISDTVSVVWDVPGTPAAHTLYVVVDPTNAIREFNESNNTASRGVVQPDLVVAWTWAEIEPEAITLTASIDNVGHLTAGAPFDVAFRAGDPVTGTLLGTASVSADLSAGASTTASLSLTGPAALAALPNRFWAVADDGDAVAEADETNNTDFGALNVKPDLVLTASDIDAGAAISLTVRNTGAFTATGVMLRGWLDGLGGTVVYSGTIGDLAPGASAEAQFTSDAAGELWVKVDPDDRIAETIESNNLAVRAVPTAVYLPLVMNNIGVAAVQEVAPPEHSDSTDALLRHLPPAR